MTLAHIALGIGVITTGLFTGLLLTMILIFQPVLNSLNASEYTMFMQRFLKVARISPLNIVLIITSIIAPIVALILIRENTGSPIFLLTLVGLLVFIVGVFLISRTLNEPLYDVIDSWIIQSPPDDWQEFRDRWYRLNLLRMPASGLAFMLFLIAFGLPLF